MYIKLYDYCGMDWHDSEKAVYQLKWNNEYDIPKDKIIECIYQSIKENYETKDEDEIEIKKAISSKEEKSFKVQSGEIFIREFKVEGVYDGGYEYHCTYDIEDIPKEHICYLPEEQFYNFTERIDLVERFYHEPFYYRKEAEAYIKNAKPHSVKSKFVLLVHDITKIKQTDIYKANMEVIELSKKYGLTEIYHPLVMEHLKLIKEKLEENVS